MLFIVLLLFSSLLFNRIRNEVQWEHVVSVSRATDTIGLVESRSEGKKEIGCVYYRSWREKKTVLNRRGSTHVVL